MNDEYYEYLMDTFKDVISDLATHLPFYETGSEKAFDKGKLEAYMDIMHMIFEDHETRYLQGGDDIGKN